MRVHKFKRRWASGVNSDEDRIEVLFGTLSKRGKGFAEVTSG